jgi:hypothetical protein
VRVRLYVQASVAHIDLHTRGWKTTIGIRMAHQVRPIKRLEAEGSKTPMGSQLDACPSKRDVTWPRQVS